MKKLSTLLCGSLLVFGSFAYATPPEQFMQHMYHVNPVPNYVAVINKNSAALGLSEEQMSQVMAWNKENTAKMQAMVMSVVEGEKNIKQASMNGTDAKEIMAMGEKLNATRLSIIEGKTRCRDRMLEILTDAQWKNLTALISGQ